MLFTHWTNDPRWRPDPARRYVQFDAHEPSERPECHGAKPEGLWLSVDDGGRGWRWWASSEMPGKLGSAAIKAEADISRLLVLEDGEAWGIVESLLSRSSGGLLGAVRSGWRLRDGTRGDRWCIPVMFRAQGGWFPSVTPHGFLGGNVSALPLPGWCSACPMTEPVWLRAATAGGAGPDFQLGVGAARVGGLYD